MKAPQWYLREIDAAKKREKDFRKKGKEILEIYSGKKQNAFNILYSNTETLLPAVYSAIPKPIVERRHKDEDPVGKASSLAAQRGLSFLFDTNVEGYETFDQGIRAAILDALLPGRGVTAIHYDADTSQGYKGPELVCLDAVKWDKVYFGYAEKWSEVPWVCYEYELDKEEAKKLLGNLPEELRFTNEQGDEPKEGSIEAKSQVLTATIYRLQVKSDRKVVFLSEQVKEKFLKTVDDPLGLTGFFDCPKPIMFMEKNDLCPTALYSMYEVQAKELNRIQVRITKIVEAIKARGAYDGGLGDEIAQILEQEDNALIPTDKGSTLSAEGGLQNSIWMMPIDMLVAALQQLYVARDSCKQVIFEIIGLADIMRGASNASETLGAQEIKQQWGSLRLKRLQKEVMRYVRDCERMMLEVAANKFSESTWAAMTGLPFLTEEQAMRLQAQVQGMQQQMAMNPPQQGQPDPMQQQFQQLQMELQKPKWSDVLALLKDDTTRAYRIDIETNSTLGPEASEDQKQTGELLNGIGQALNGIGPLVEKGVLPFEAAKGVVMMVTRKFPVGKEVEDMFAQMKEPPKPPDPAAAEAEKEKAKQEAEMQREQMRMQAEQQRRQMESQNQQAQLQKDAAVEMEKARQETEQLRLKLESEERIKRAEIQSKKDIAANEAKMRMQSAIEVAKIQAGAQMKMKKMEANVKEDEDTEEELTGTEVDAPVEPSKLDQVLEAQQQGFQILAEGQAKLLATIAAPVEHERDSTGRIKRSLRVVR